MRASVFVLTAFGCSSTRDSHPGTGGSPSAGGAAGSDAGAETAVEEDPSSGGTANMAGASVSSGGAFSSSGSGGKGGSETVDGDGGADQQPAAGGNGNEGLRTSSEVAESCVTPMSTFLGMDEIFGWKTAALRIDPSRPHCELQAGVGVGSGGNALYFAHESNDTYSIWSDDPWSLELEPGQSANELPQQTPLTVFPFQDGLRLRVVFSLSNDTVTVSAVTAQ